MDQILVHLWHSIFGWVGVTGTVLAGAVYLYLNTTSPAIRNACTLTAAVCLGILFLYPKAYLDGANHVKNQVVAREQKLRDAGQAAHADALADTIRGLSDPFDSDAK